MKKIYGRKPVLEALNSGRELDKIILNFTAHNPAIEKIIVAAKKRGVKVTKLSPKKFAQYENRKQNSQGVIAFVSDLKSYSVEDLILEKPRGKFPLILVLDTIQDTHNLGAIFRTAEAAGVDGIIVTENKSAPINETVEKTSAGALSYLKIAKVQNLANALRTLKENGFWVIGTALGAEKKYDEIDYTAPIALVMGNEEKGIRKLTAQLCDELVSIPMVGEIQSLNVSVATGILLYEILRQRKER
jgi:23S rRNA (guanosine2251-2'-O)-methyltransferase